jgi:hypothetical protein
MNTVCSRCASGARRGDGVCRRARDLHAVNPLIRRESLFELLSDRKAGLAAIDALGEMGDLALERLERGLDDAASPPELRWRVVRALARSSSPRALDLLARRAVSTDDTGLRSRILRVLRAAQGEGEAAPLSRAELVALAQQSVLAQARALAFRVAHARSLEAEPERKTPGADLVQRLLRDKEVEAIDRLFLVLALLHPSERFARIQRGLESPNAKARASSRELVENVVKPPLREPVLAAIGDEPDDARLRAMGGAPRAETTYADLVRAMIAQGGELRAIAVYHAHETGLGAAVGVDATISPASSAEDLARDASGRDLPAPSSSELEVAT